MSLQKAFGSGRGTLRWAAPVRRSKPFRALTRSPPPEGPPKALKSLEQAQRIPEASSANTPVIDREPDAPGATKSATAPVRGIGADDTAFTKPANEECPIRRRSDALRERSRSWKCNRQWPCVRRCHPKER